MPKLAEACLVPAETQVRAPEHSAEETDAEAARLFEKLGRIGYKKYLEEMK